jgi:hypothetical protein
MIISLIMQKNEKLIMQISIIDEQTASKEDTQTISIPNAYIINYSRNRKR